MTEQEKIEAVADRFWSKVDVGHTDECWAWKARRTLRGYGQFNVLGKTARAHRIAYTLKHGPIPAGLYVCHRCDYPPCCNPSHLFLGTALENNLDKTKKGRNVRPARDEQSVRYQRGQGNGSSKLTEADVLKIRELKILGHKPTSLAQLFGVHKSLIWLICTRRLWSHLP